MLLMQLELVWVLELELVILKGWRFGRVGPNGRFEWIVVVLIRLGRRSFLEIGVVLHHLPETAFLAQHVLFGWHPSYVGRSIAPILRLDRIQPSRPSKQQQQQQQQYNKVSYLTLEKHGHFDFLFDLVFFYLASMLCRVM